MKTMTLLNQSPKFIFKYIWKLIYNPISKVDVNDKDIKLCLRFYFEDNDINYWSWGITNIKTITPNSFKEDVVVEISLHRPGLLIGRAGSTIDAINKRLTEFLKRPVKIKINEVNIWK